MTQSIHSFSSDKILNQSIQCGMKYKQTREKIERRCTIWYNYAEWYVCRYFILNNSVSILVLPFLDFKYESVNSDVIFLLLIKCSCSIWLKSILFAVHAFLFGIACVFDTMILNFRYSMVTNVCSFVFIHCIYSDWVFNM